MAKSERTGAQALVESLSRAGVERIFGYPGGNVLDIFESLRTSTINFVLARHEQGCVHMADGYARASGRPGVALVTSGPGLTNTITGLGTAHMDGIPLVCICGQVPLDQIGTDAFQEADTTGLTRAVSKHNFLVKSADEIPETVAQAFYIATHGKPGVVVIDVPRDCQRAVTKATYPERICLRAYHPERSPAPHEVNALARLLNGAKRPLILAGGGVVASEAEFEMIKLAHKASIPVATTMMGLGAINEHDLFALGMSGVYGTRAANAAIGSADVILALGVRFNDRTTGPVETFARKARIVHVDCDPSSINKNVMVHLGIVADVKELLTILDSRIHPAKHDSWLASCTAKRTHAIESRAKAGTLSPHVFFRALSQGRFDRNRIITTDVGQHQLWAVRDLCHRASRSFLASGGMGSMGFGIPAAIGASFARAGCPVMAFVGDGGAQMTANELIVAVEHKLPITFVVFVNRTLGLVHQMQRTAYRGQTFATDLSSPDFVLLAKAMGLKAERVAKASQIAPALTRASRTSGPYLLEVLIDPSAEV